MQIELAALCDGLEASLGKKLERLSAADLLWLLRKIDELTATKGQNAQGSSQPVTKAQNAQGTSQGRAGQGGIQPITKAQNAQGTSQGRAVVANGRRAERVRAVVEIAGQGTEQGTVPANEARALELLRAGYSERRLLDQLKAEGLTLNKNKLKGLRALV